MWVLVDFLVMNILNRLWLGIVLLLVIVICWVFGCFVSVLVLWFYMS